MESKDFQKCDNPTSSVKLIENSEDIENDINIQNDLDQYLLLDQLFDHLSISDYTSDQQEFQKCDNPTSSEKLIVNSVVIENDINIQSIVEPPLYFDELLDCPSTSDYTSDQQEFQKCDNPTSSEKLIVNSVVIENDINIQSIVDPSLFSYELLDYPSTSDYTSDQQEFQKCDNPTSSVKLIENSEGIENDINIQNDLDQYLLFECPSTSDDTSDLQVNQHNNSSSSNYFLSSDIKHYDTVSDDNEIKKVGEIVLNSNSRFAVKETNQKTNELGIDYERIEPSNLVKTYDQCQKLTNNKPIGIHVEVISSAINNSKSFCFICGMKNRSKNYCLQHNKELSACLVPGCNIIFRSLKDFMLHYLKHIGISNNEKMCIKCYHEHDENQINCYAYNTLNLFKCFICGINQRNMLEFALHKWKKHYGRLLNSMGHYLCYYCEKSDKDPLNLGKHIQYCLMKQLKIERKNITSGLIKSNFFACLSPSCNSIFLTFNHFQLHHRKHINKKSGLICWHCIKTFSNKSDLLRHQSLIGSFITKYKCFECSLEFIDFNYLSIHKYTNHNGRLITLKCIERKKCPSCDDIIKINHLKEHLIKCVSEHKITSKPFGNKK